MFNRFGLLAVTAGLLFAGSAHSGELKPIEAGSFTLGTVSGVVYYTPEATGYRVVATLQDGTDQIVARVVATLAPEQSITLSTPRGVGQSPIEVRLVRHGNDLLLDDSGQAARNATITALTSGQ